MNRWLLGILIAVVGIAVVAGIANNFYQAGVARGLAETKDQVPGTERPIPGPYYGPYGYYGYRPFGFGFGFFGFLFPLLFIFLIFALFKGLFWGWRGPYWGGRFEEWHRREHESMKEHGQKM